MKLINRSKFIMEPATKVKCPKCFGDGSRWPHDTKCDLCRGHGVVWKSDRDSGWYRPMWGMIGESERMW